MVRPDFKGGDKTLVPVWGGQKNIERTSGEDPLKRGRTGRGDTEELLATHIVGPGPRRFRGRGGKLGEIIKN